MNETYYTNKEAYTEVCAAARHRETAKRSRYSTVPGLVQDPHVPPPSSAHPPPPFIPFAIEASGRLGPAAKHLIDFLCGNDFHYARSYFLNFMNSILAKYNACMLQEARDRIIH